MDLTCKDKFKLVKSGLFLSSTPIREVQLREQIYVSVSGHYANICVEFVGLVDLNS
jgi:hypothetical protein